MAGEKEGDVEMSAVPEGQHQRGESLGQSIRGAAAAVLGAEQMRALEDPSLINSTRGSVLGGSFGSKVHIAGASRSLVSSLRNPEDGSIRENITELHPEDGQADYGPARVSNWYNTSFIIMAEIMGTGILSLPSTMAGLGYILGSVAIVVMAVAVYFQGFLLAKVKNRYYSQALSYGDLAYILNGGAFEKFTRGLLYANWFALLCYYILALTSSLMSAFYFSGPTCFWEWGLIAVACLVPFAQLRTFHAMSFLAMLSTLAIIAAVAIIAAAFITGTTTETYSPATLSVPPQSFLSGYTNIANIIFAFQGQSEFYEMMGEMKNPKKFPLSLGVAQIVMGVMYLFTAVLAYHYGGADVNGFVLYSLPTNRLRTVCALLIAIHIVVAYIITGQPLTYKLHQAMSPRTLHASGAKSALVHLGTTLMILIVGYVVANVIPFFSDMQGIIAALAASAIVFFYPSYFYMSSAKRAGDWAGVPIYEKIYIYFVLVFVFPFCFGVGLAAAIDGIVTSWSGAGQPFACIVSSQL